MPERMFSRWDPLNPTNILAAVLLGFAFGVYHRPYLPDILPSYHAFDDLMPWSWWGWVAFGTALLMLVSPRGSFWKLTAHALCGLFLLGVATAFGKGVGITSGTTTYTVLSVISMVLFARTAVYWQSQWRWWQRIVENPPRWLRRLAGIDEFDSAQCRVRVKEDRG